MKRGANAKNVVFGQAVVLVDDKLIGLTRDGVKFSVEYEYRAIEADGDRAKVRGRIIKEKAIPKAEINHLELLTRTTDMHPGLKVDTKTSPGHTIISGTETIDDENDYHKIEIRGRTKDGRTCTAGIKQAINLENIEWEFKDKNDVIDKVTFEGVEEEEQETIDEGWYIDYETGAE